MTIDRPNCVKDSDSSQLASQIRTKMKRGKFIAIALVTAFLVCTLIVCFVAVIIFSPLVRGGENEWSTSTAEDNLRFSSWRKCCREQTTRLNCYKNRYDP